MYRERLARNMEISKICDNRTRVLLKRLINFFGKESFEQKLANCEKTVNSFAFFRTNGFKLDLTTENKNTNKIKKNKIKQKPQTQLKSAINAPSARLDFDLHQVG